MATSSISFLLLLALTLSSYARNPIHLVNNKYTTVLVAINENVAEDRRLVDYIKEIFTNASHHLHEATNQRATFGDVTILIPKTWSDDITTVRATTEMYDIANVIVDHSNPDYGDSPYTKQTRPCGEKGEYIHLTPRWIADRPYSEQNWGDSGKVIVHEWGHLQWGIFDEYPGEGEHYYLDLNGTVQPSRCSDAITGDSFDYNPETGRLKRCNTDPTSGVLPGPNCRFYPNDDGAATGSYMFANYLSSVNHFCHSDPNGDPSSRHNPLALNKHNTQCAYRSAWDVMDNSLDFKNANPPRSGLTTEPTFNVVKETEFRTVLVMDVSGSMSSHSRIQTQHQAAAKYIGSTLPDDSWVGIVQFQSSARELAPLTKLVDEQTRQDLINLLPNLASGGTCIGCGLQEGVRVLERSHFGDAAGGVIFLTTDGAENVSPTILDTLPYLVNKSVVVDTLAFSSQADPKLVDLSNQTNGRSCWYSESDGSTAIHDCFTASLTERTSSNSETPVQLTSYKASILASGTEFGSVHIDSTIGRDTVFFFFWDFGSTREVDVKVTRPNGITIEKNDPQYESNTASRSIAIRINDIAEDGLWLYEVHNPDSRNQVVEISIDSKSIDSSTEPIRLSSTPSTDMVTESPPMVTIYADVKQGHSPVLNAHVIAAIERPSPLTTVELQLFDTGTGADITKDDGVYSGYFVEFVEASCSTACRYSIQVTANDTEGNAISRVMGKVGAMPRNYSVIPEKTEGTPIGDFNRVASGGVIQVDDNVDYVDWSDPNADPFPPSRITDLQVVETSIDNSTVTLTWTATGDDYDQGTASRYDLRYDTDFSKIVSDFANCEEISNDDVSEGTLTDPLPSGQREMLTVTMPSSGAGFTYYYSIRAVDGAGNAAQPSNVAQTTIVAAPPPDTLTTVGYVQPIQTGLTSWQILLIAVTAVVLAIVCIAVVALAYSQYKKTKRLTKVEPFNEKGTQTPKLCDVEIVVSDI
ncbi:calcium-activated chloride channel regulator 4A-like [Ptychodera flava]|uniref:calcium-activated chloride channel regulator 4A-like n=1 Tax=Ptychodera flava TaxID=63121 RepID=UPI003969DA88